MPVRETIYEIKISGLGGGLSAIGLIKQRTQSSVSEESDDETLG